MPWLYLIIGGLFEVGFVLMMKKSDGLKILKYTIATFICMSSSLYFLSLGLKYIDLGVGYSIWSGMGAVGSLLAGVFFFKEKINTIRLILILMIIIGIIGLKLSA